MARKAPQLAKLTRPRLHKAVARERLFAKLDEVREHKPAICVVGPPGAGKTTLVASWLDARGIKGIWYQIDPGDADLATFFYYLGEAARPFSRKGLRPLPLLTPEYLQAVEGLKLMDPSANSTLGCSLMASADPKSLTTPQAGIAPFFRWLIEGGADEERRHTCLEATGPHSEHLP